MNTSELITDIVPSDGRYYPQGEHVRRAPINKGKSDGGTTYEIGFTVCRMSAYVPAAAPVVAAALNAYRHIHAAVSLLQSKAARHSSMQAFYRDNAATEAASLTRRDHMVDYDLTAAIKEQREAAEASATARRLMGIEPAPIAEYAGETEAA